MFLPGNDANSIAACADCIRAGGLLGLPTETVYGLAADADNDTAVAQIYRAKGRPADHPLIVHVATLDTAMHFACDVPDFAKPLIHAFWPGPLTLILPRRPGIATAAAGGHATIGLRCPSHPVALALLQVLNHGNIWGLAAPSANAFGRVSPTTALHVQNEFGHDLMILDGGACQVGIESTIIDCTRGQPVLLRPGEVTPDQVSAICGLAVLSKDEIPTLADAPPNAPGTLASHYAPRARVRLMKSDDLKSALDETNTSVGVWSRVTVETSKVQVLYRPMPEDAASAAQQVFAVLRDFDDLGVSQIWIETVPNDAQWDAIRDRLQRAAS